ncbi:MAG TPA: hypothetical protein VFZ66_01180 [Herpetosiphonaceae bacterium]
MWWRRTLELIGQVTVGDGVTTIVAPQGHMYLWRDALPWQWWRSLAEWLAAHPGLLRTIGALELLGGAWLCVRASRGVR